MGRHGLHSRRPRTLCDDEGLALVLALLFVVLLTAIVVEFAYEMQVDASLIGRNSTNTEAYLGARSSIALSMSVLAADLLIGEQEAGQDGAQFYDGLDEPWASSTPLVKFNDAMVSINITDEYGKINLNALIYEDESGQELVYQPLVDALTTIFDARSVENSPVDAILDWLDADDDPRPLGFENSYYQSLETPYQCKNGPMDSIEELLLIPGITPEVFFGEGDQDPPLPPLSELLTVHGNPEGKVNINTAPRDVLDAMFSADPTQADPVGMTDQVVQRLQDVGPYVSWTDLRSEGLIPAPRERGQGQNGQNDDQDEQDRRAHQPDLFDVRSSVFRIRGDSQSGDSQVRVEAYVWRDTPQQGARGVTTSGAAQMFRIIDWRIVQ